MLRILIIIACFPFSFLKGQNSSLLRSDVQRALDQTEQLEPIAQKLLLEGMLSKAEASFGLQDTTSSKILGALSDYHFKNRNFNRALHYAQQRLANLQAIGLYPEKIALAATQAGECYKWNYRFKDSEKHFQLSLDTRSDRTDSKNFQNYIGLAIARQNTGNYQMCIDYARFALGISTNRIDDCEALYYMFFGYIQLRQLEEAKQLTEQCLKISKQNNLIYQEGRAYTQMGWISMSERKYEEAIANYQRALDILELSSVDKKRRNMASAFTTMSNAYSRLGDSEKAINYAKRAVEYTEEFFAEKYHPEVGIKYHNIAAKYSRQKDYESAIRFGQQAIKCYLRDPTFNDSRKRIPKNTLYNVSVKWDLLLSLKEKGIYYAHLYLRHGNVDDLESCQRHFDNAVELVDVMRGELSTERAKKYRSRQTRLVYDYAIETSEWKGDLEAVQKFIEKSRSLVLLDELNHKSALSLIPEDLRAREERLKSKFDGSLEVDMSAFEEYNRFIDSIKTDYPNYYSFKYDTQTPTIKEVQSNFIDDSTQILQYYITYDSLYVLNITKDEIEFSTQPRPKRLKSQIEKIIQLVSNKDSLEYLPIYERFIEKSQSLYSTLFKGIHSFKPNVIVIPDGELNYLPFDILIDKVEEGVPRYLIQKHAFSYAPSLSILKKLKRNNQLDNFLFINPKTFSDSSLISLNYDEAEIESFGSVANLSVIQKETATYTYFNKVVEDYDILHFSTHSGVDSITEKPWIAFNDTLVGLDELFKLKLNAALVVLSSCKSLDGLHSVSEGVNSLARAFLYANASSVLGSSWDLNELAGFEVLKEFYKHLQKGKNKAEALREAKLFYLENHPYKSPFYWAPMTLMGESSPVAPVVSESKSNVLGIILFVVFVSVLLLQLKAKSSTTD